MSAPKKKFLAAVSIALMGLGPTAKVAVAQAQIGSDLERLRLMFNTAGKPEGSLDKQAGQATGTLANLISNRLVNQPADALQQILLLAQSPIGAEIEC